MSLIVGTCPKCSSPMESGFILEQHLSECAPSLWIDGPADASYWTEAKVDGRVKRLVETYRCTACGFLESYAKSVWGGKVET